LRTEFLYWMAILMSSTLGTAFGDFLSDETPLGFGGATLVLIAALIVVAVISLTVPLSRTVCYWLAIVVSHPLGATMGDYMTKDEGLQLCTIPSTIALLCVFLAIAAVGELLRRRRDPAIEPA